MKTDNYTDSGIITKNFGKLRTFSYLVAVVLILIAKSTNINAQQLRILDQCNLHLKGYEYEVQKMKTNKSTELYNFNPIVSRDTFASNNGFFKNAIAGESSIFLVFSSTEKKEVPIMEVSCGKTKIAFTNKKILNDKDLPYRNVEAKNGIILSYITNPEHSKRNNYISFIGFLGGTNTSNTTLLEMLYFPELILDTNRMVIESFLSIKHGISLLGNKDYYNSKNEKIWDSKINESFNTRVTGIGRDDVLGLLQKQSKNSMDDGLIIGLDKIAKTNAENPAILKDLNYELWGDNNKSSRFYESDDHNISKISRIWAVEIKKETSDTISNQVLVRTDKLFENADSTGQKVIWLTYSGTLRDTLNPEYIRQDISDDGFAVFNHVNFDKAKTGHCNFSFIQAPDFFARVDIDRTNCKCQNSGDLNYRMHGGQGPFQIVIKGDKYSNSLSSIENEYVLKNIPAGKYTTTITDIKGKTYSNVIQIEQEKMFTAKLASNWALSEDNRIEIKPEIIKNTNSVNYKWVANDSVFSSDTVFIANKPGNYELLLTNSDGCSQKLQFTVDNKNSPKEKITVFPNPLKINGMCHIAVVLEARSDVEITISNITGAVLKTLKLTDILSYEHVEKMLVPGSYLIIVKINSNTYTHRLVVG